VNDSAVSLPVSSSLLVTLSPTGSCHTLKKGVCAFCTVCTDIAYCVARAISFECLNQFPKKQIKKVALQYFIFECFIQLFLAPD
jgi:predicted DNA-binding helix-hairpin-helix protein